MEFNLDKLKSTMIALQNKNNVIANNLANLNNVGFKKEASFLQLFSDEIDPGEALIVETDFTQGELQETNNPLDLAINGRGFFTIEIENGEAYTRDGHFRVDGDGVLRTSTGNPALGENGWIILTRNGLTPKEVSITQKGEVIVDDEVTDKLKISDFADPSDLRKIGNNLFINRDGANRVEPAEFTIQQGFLENSNVNPVDEMIGLIEVQRQFESSQQLVRMFDEVFKLAANQIGAYR